MTARPALGRGRAARVLLASGAALFGALLVGAGVSSASIDVGTPPLQIRAIDARNGKVSVDFLTSDNNAPASAKVTIGGTTTATEPKAVSTLGQTSSAVVVLDNGAAVPNATVQLSKEDMTVMAPGASAFDKVGLITAGDGARIASQPVGSMNEVTPVFNEIVPRGRSSLWDALVAAATMASSMGNTQRNVVLVVASPDDGSLASYTKALTALRDADVMLHVVAIKGSSADGAALREMVGRLGGSFQVGADTDFKKMYGHVSSLVAHQYRATVDTKRLTGELANLELQVGKNSIAASFRPNILSVGADAVRAVPAATSEDSSWITGDAGKYLIVALAAAGAFGAFFAIANLMTKRRDGLKQALRYYDESYGGGMVGDEAEQGLAKSAILQRAVEVTGKVAEDRGFLVRVSDLLERADLPLRPAEALTFYLGGAAASVLVAFVLTGSPMATLAVVILALIAPGFVVDFLAKRRKKRFNRILPDMLQLLAGTLRAGYSIGQGFEAVSGEVEEPMGKELRRAVTEARLGRPLDEALEAVAIRMDSEDFGWAVMAIRIQREVGGNLAELLMTVSDTMIQRERLRRDVASLTAEGRMSAIILGMLPPGLGVVMYFMNTEYISKLFSGTGLFLLGASIVMMFIGFFWMKKTITIEV